MAFDTLARYAHLYPAGQCIKRGYFWIRIEAVQLLPCRLGRSPEVRVWYSFES